MDSNGKQKVVFNYKNSGVKTLNGFGVFFYVIGIIAAAITVIAFLAYLGDMDSSSGETGLSLASSFFPVTIGSFVSGAVCTGLSNIARTALYKRLLLEEKYLFEEEVKDKNNKVTI